MIRRREFLASLSVATTTLLVSRVLSSQESVASQQSGSSNLFDMNQEAAKTVRRPAKPGATPSMSADERDDLEHQIRCQCGCTLDIYTCRTTDFSCQVSPAMHRDVMSLVEGGYSAREIMDAFVTTYGERALMAPKREGFNLAGYLVPFAALAAGATALTIVLRRMQRRSVRLKVDDEVALPVHASGEELAKLQAAVRRDE